MNIKINLCTAAILALGIFSACGTDPAWEGYDPDQVETVILHQQIETVILHEAPPPSEDGLIEVGENEEEPLDDEANDFDRPPNEPIPFEDAEQEVEFQNLD